MLEIWLKAFLKCAVITFLIGVTSLFVTYLIVMTIQWTVVATVLDAMVNIGLIALDAVLLCEVNQKAMLKAERGAKA